MKLLYISYWGINDVLTQATVIPNVRILRPYFSEIYLATIERAGGKCVMGLPDVIHIPFYSWRTLPRVLQKCTDVILFSWKLLLTIKRNDIKLIVCRGSLAALFGVVLNRITGKPFIVESFEPHADYMVEASVWKVNGIETRMQKWVEHQSMRRARYVLPVSYNYHQIMIEEGLESERVIVMPCCVNFDRFRFHAEDRSIIRKKLNIDDQAVVGAYVGKFGDIYLREEAFQIFSRAQSVFGEKFHLIILTPDNKEQVKTELARAGFNLRNLFIDFVEQERVPQYLSASDFAFALIRPSASRRFCSPVKIGEYWANGLPVLLTKGVGDDEQIVLENRAGVIIDFAKSFDSCLHEMKRLLVEGRAVLEERISPLAKRYRSFDLIAEGYERILRSVRSEQS